MLIAALVLAAQVPIDYNGIWISTDNETIAIIHDDALSIFKGNRYLYTDRLKPVDNGGFYGEWKSSEKPGYSRGEDSRLDPPWTIIARFPKEVPDGELGEIRMTDGVTKPDGTLTGIYLRARDGHQETVCDDLFTYKGKSLKMNLAGTYKDSNFDLQISESDGRSHRDISGSLTLLGRTYTVTGQRFWQQVMFKITDRDNGSEFGIGYLVWRPTADWFKGHDKIEDGEVTDQILFALKTSSSIFQNGTYRLMKRSKD